MSAQDLALWFYLGGSLCFAAGTLILMGKGS